MPAHRMIRDTAYEMAAAVWEQCAKNNDWYNKFPNQKVFANNEWPKFVGEARATLAEMLKGNIDEDLKERIADALIKDTYTRPPRPIKGTPYVY